MTTLAPAAIPQPVRRRGGATGRRAVSRWAWRLFEREWKRQLLILSLLTFAVVATVVGLGVISNANVLHNDPTFGSANTDIQLSGSPAVIATDVAYLEHRFHPVDVIDELSVPVPGAVNPLQIEAANPHGPYVHVILRLDSGRYPTGADQVAMTSGTAGLLGLHVGSSWRTDGRTFRVVGLVENPLDLLDQFALVAPGQLPNPNAAVVLLNGTRALDNLSLPGQRGVVMGQRGTSGQAQAAALVLAVATVLLLFVGLLAVAGFAVLAHRRLRSLGMLSSLGATDRHVRRVMVVNGAAVGITAALVGLVIGFLAWLAAASALQSSVEHRVNPLNLPWWALGAALVLAFVTSVIAAWWPARSVARMPVVAALSGRPPRPQPARRFAGAGLAILALGIVLLAFADHDRTGFIIGGCLASVVGLVLLAPLAIQGLALLARRLPFVVRLAIRDLARFQARSGAALGAATLAVGIAATIVIAGAASIQSGGAPNLSTSELLFHVNGTAAAGANVPSLSVSERATADRRVGAFAAAVDAGAPLELQVAINPQSKPMTAQELGPGQGAGRQPATLGQVHQLNRGEAIGNMVDLYVATPAVLTYYHVNPASIRSGVDVLTSQKNLVGRQIVADFGGPGHLPVTGAGVATHPVIQTVAGLPKDTSAPTTLITPAAVKALGLEAVPAGWLVQARHPLSAGATSSATKLAAALGMSAETHTAAASYAGLKKWSTGVGFLMALGVLAMTVGLIRSESGSDLRTLTATGASSGDRRNLSAATSGSLGVLAGLLGTAGAYAALFAWYRSDLHPLTNIPVAELLVLVVALPVAAFGAGWLLAGREPAGVSRQPLE